MEGMAVLTWAVIQLVELEDSGYTHPLDHPEHVYYIMIVVIVFTVNNLSQHRSKVKKQEHFLCLIVVQYNRCLNSG